MDFQPGCSTGMCSIGQSMVRNMARMVLVTIPSRDVLAWCALGFLLHPQIIWRLEIVWLKDKHSWFCAASELLAQEAGAQ